MQKWAVFHLISNVFMNYWWVWEGFLKIDDLKRAIIWKEFVKKCLFQLSIKSPPKPPVRAGPKPTKQGFLDKLSGGKHKAPKWDNRYFELTETGYLYYYKKPDGGKPINSIYLRGCPVEIDQNDSCIIIVKSEERDWNLKAVNPGEASAWKDALSFYTDKQNWKKKRSSRHGQESGFDLQRLSSGMWADGPSLL